MATATETPIPSIEEPSIVEPSVEDAAIEEPPAATVATEAPTPLRIDAPNDRAIDASTDVSTDSDDSPDPLLQTLPPASKRPKSKDLSRDDRIRILTIRSLGHDYAFIARHLGCTYAQARAVCRSTRASPVRRPGRTPRLSKLEKEAVERYVTQSKNHRTLSFKEVAEALFPDRKVSDSTIRRALQARGYVRRNGVLVSMLTRSSQTQPVGTVQERPAATEVHQPRPPPRPAVEVPRVEQRPDGEASPDALTSST